MKYNYIKYSISDSIASVSLSRPDYYNALNPEMLDELFKVFKFLETQNTVKVIILKGEGKGFCAGQDLKMLDFSQTLSATQTIENFYKPAILSVAHSRYPVICQLHGNAAGAGMALALACDVILMAETAVLSPGFVKIGLAPDSGASYFLLNLVGERKAFEILTLGERITAQEALRLNLANRILADEDLETKTREFASALASGPPLIIQSVKRLLKQQSGLSLENVISLEAVYQEMAVKTEDFREAVSAFREKRNPEFKGC